MRIEVFAGMNTLWEGNPAYRATVERRDIRPHPQYSRETLINDIGLVFVLRRFVFSNLVQRIALPPQSEMNNRFLGSAATVIGWGWTNDCKLDINSFTFKANFKVNFFPTSSTPSPFAFLAFRDFTNNC